ncbi:MAG: FAD-dependent monooxygenase [Planctomycetes bacterium]|nr:FAD-dependent monooxygenase [Planctomycetota bacterium]
MPRAVVIGAGIGGLTAAIALKQTGWDVSVCERAPELREVGAGITLWTNAVKVLRKLGAGEAVEAAAAPIKTSEVRSWRGKLLIRADFGALGQRLGAPCIGIHRADLQAKLADALGREHIQYGMTCVAYNRDGKGANALFAEGDDVRGQILVGADGIKSLVRNQLLGPEQPRYAGYTAWRGVALIDRPEVPVGVTVLAMGRGSQVGMLPIGGGRTYWFATQNVPPDGVAGPGGHKADLLKLFGNWWPAFPAAVEATPDAAILRNDIIDRVPVRKWTDGRVALLGDSAHPTTPNLGQGACQAIESGYVLAKCLKEAETAEAGLSAYEQSRFDRTAQITNESWKVGKILAYENPLKCWFRDRMFGLLGGLSMRHTEKLIGVEV